MGAKQSGRRPLSKSRNRQKGSWNTEVEVGMERGQHREDISWLTEYYRQVVDKMEYDDPGFWFWCFEIWLCVGKKVHVNAVVFVFSASCC